MFACQDDFNFESEDSEFVSTYEIRPKGDLGFKTKKGKTRIVPLTLRLAKALQTWFDFTGDRRLVFTNRDGTSCTKLKNIAFRLASTARVTSQKSRGPWRRDSQ